MEVLQLGADPLEPIVGVHNDRWRGHQVDYSRIPEPAELLEVVRKK